MIFKTFQLFIDDDFPKMEDLANVVEHGVDMIHDGQEFYKITKSMVDNRFFGMYCQYDNFELYNDTVWNDVEEKEEHNPRKKSQIEYRYQLFICYDIKKELLYMSDMTKKPFLKRYLCKTLNKDVEVKNIIHSLEEFQSIVKTIKEATFIQTRNIQNSVPTSLFMQTANVYGFDAPERLYVKVDCGDSPISTMKRALQNFKRKNDTGEFQNVVVVGKDDSGIENSFDFSSIIESIKIEISKDENEHFVPQEVQRLILQEIR